jgi:hypothetical protein
MFITFDYKCINPDCTEFNKQHERFHIKDDVQTCKSCGKTLEKMPCAPKQPHVSWSLWRV